MIVELDTPHSLTNGSIDSWDAFFHALQEHFYPPGYLDHVLAKWLQLRRLSTQSLQGYIDVFYRRRIQLHINDPDMVLIPLLFHFLFHQFFSYAFHFSIYPITFPLLLIRFKIYPHIIILINVCILCFSYFN